MKRFSTLVLAVAVALTGMLFAPKSAEAIPAFARQVGVPCLSCHFQHMGPLNAFGREFKLGGMTQSSQELIEDDGISLPPVANIGYIFKTSYVKTDPVTATPSGSVESGTARGRLRVPDEAALWVGGRLGENWGFASEGALSPKIVFSTNLGGVQAGFSIFETDGMGVAYGMGIFNTGVTKNHKSFDGSAGNIVQQKGYGNAGSFNPYNGAVTGIALFGGSDMFFANVTLFGPAAESNGTAAIDTALDLSVYYRVAVTPKVAEGVDLMVGVFGTSGSTKLSTSNSDSTVGALTEIDTKSTGIDFQVQMEDLAGMSLQVTGAYLTAGDNGTSNVDAFGGEKTGFDVNASLGLAPNAGVKLAYQSFTDKKSGGDTTATATTIGGWINFAQNIMLRPQYTLWSGDDKTAGNGGGYTNNNELILLLELGF